MMTLDDEMKPLVIRPVLIADAPVITMIARQSLDTLRATDDRQCQYA